MLFIYFRNAIRCNSFNFKRKADSNTVGFHQGRSDWCQLAFGIGWAALPQGMVQMKALFQSIALRGFTGRMLIFWDPPSFQRTESISGCVLASALFLAALFQSKYSCEYSNTLNLKPLFIQNSITEYDLGSFKKHHSYLLQFWKRLSIFASQ